MAYMLAVTIKENQYVMGIFASLLLLVTDETKFLLAPQQNRA